MPLEGNFVSLKLYALSHYSCLSYSIIGMASHVHIPGFVILTCRLTKRGKSPKPKHLVKARTRRSQEAFSLRLQRAWTIASWLSGRHNQSRLPPLPSTTRGSTPSKRMSQIAHTTLSPSSTRLSSRHAQRPPNPFIGVEVVSTFSAFNNTRDIFPVYKADIALQLQPHPS